MSPPTRRRMKRAFLLSATIAGASSSSIISEKSSSSSSSSSSSLQHLRGRDDVPSTFQPQHQLYQRQHRQRALQEPNPDNRYCGTNWQTAHDSCDTPCPSAKDEDCGPGMYCFGYVDCTPPEPLVEEPVLPIASTVSAAALPNEAPVLPPSDYTPSAVAAPTPSTPAATPTIPSSIASLPLAPSEPTTPAPFTIPVPTPNTLPNPNSFYCGYGYESALAECYYACPSGKNEECPGGRTCHGWLSCNQAPEDPALFNTCGSSWADASTKCATRCFLGGDDTCPQGETCFGNVVECRDKLPALTAVDVGQAEPTYTQEEMDAMMAEEEAKKAEEAAMSDPNNWWCGTSWSNMLETCSKRCQTDDDCAVSSWEKGTCYKTAGGPENCSTPGVPVKEASVPGSKWCGSTWNDMLETCSAQCEADEDCEGGKTCWDAPGTCQWIGVPVKEVSDKATLWCGLSFDDAAVSCHKACPSENDEDCPEGMSCFAGSACTEEGVPVVRENYRCGATWDDAAEKCGVECQKDEDCTVENGAAEGDICFADVECVKDQAGAASGMICVKNWETSQDECPTANACETDDDCESGKLCMWIDCVATNDKSGNETSPGTTTPGTLPGCSAEVQKCANGQFVARAPELNCDFYPCPEDSGSTPPAAQALTEGNYTSESMVENSEQAFESSDGQANDVAEWGTIPLTFQSPKCQGECTMCQGDCNSDDDCADGLKCFSRGSGEVTAVPGCISGGEGDLAGMDYCYSPESPPTTTTTTTTTTTIVITTTTTTTEPAELMTADIASFSAPELTFARECSAEYPCNSCEGDCDDDSHCASGLLCFSRVQGSVLFVPGCVGVGIAGMDYCYDPSAPIILPTTAIATTTAPMQEELSGCSAEVRACPGTSVLVYQNPANNCEFDPCPGESATSSASSSSTSTETPDVTSSTTFAVTTSTEATSAEGSNPEGLTTEYTSTPVANTQVANIEAASMQVASTPAGSTQVTSTSGASTVAAATTCDTLCLDVLPSSFCPTEFDGLSNCLNINIGQICEGGGECATDDSLNNCQTFDIYVRVECGGDTPSQGYLMKNPSAAQGDVTTQSPTTTLTPVGDSNSTVGNTTETYVDENHDENTTLTVPDNYTSASDSTAPTAAPSLSIVLNGTLQEITTVDFSNTTLGTVDSSYNVASAAASFTYDRSPTDSGAYTPNEPTTEYSQVEYNQTDTVSNLAFNPYSKDGGWDLDGYFTPDLRSAAMMNSRRSVILLGALAAFVVIM
ncbi:hypothetical protein HJC23_001169 [Cyclotella cryptica]|uniref:Uncharacterized protein n=1 Tax=Cyclotella cryptica TaxID=29204 RepID=A0ABD3QN92_9STRA|eukprot:CCRYP_003797-RA/>CCRYP_003797-RA protein AED:0.04 eAED:0.04 QI:268/1/1/1/0/0/2/486/1253